MGSRWNIATAFFVIDKSRLPRRRGFFVIFAVENGAVCGKIMSAEQTAERFIHAA
jgi:hypothetical protein